MDQGDPTQLYPDDLFYEEDLGPKGNALLTQLREHYPNIERYYQYKFDSTGIVVYKRQPGGGWYANLPLYRGTYSNPDLIPELLAVFAANL